MCDDDDGQGPEGCGFAGSLIGAGSGTESSVAAPPHSVCTAGCTSISLSASVSALLPATSPRKRSKMARPRSLKSSAVTVTPSRAKRRRVKGLMIHVEHWA